ncbi:MAG: UDP-2,3-diacylglucosamine diphosphatase LpxI [Rickettsiales bacterium]|jgi:DUF1009 family protein|nr:UDP-2,3-diacylglucosamine diphosphatase LpxI [Rickettsiales bacterium]
MKDKKIAIVAGSLKLPDLVAEDLARQGYDVFFVALKNFYDGLRRPERGLRPDLTIRLGALGTAIREFRKRNIKQMVMVGALGHPNIADIRPDWASIKILARIIKNQRGDDSVLKTLISEIERLGVRVLPAHKLCPDLTFDKGVLTRKRPTATDIADIKFGTKVANAIGKLDIGQSVAVRGGVLAVEAAEGTREMLARVADIRRGHKKTGGVLVKLVKPGQTTILDIPAVGVQTIEDAAAAGLNGIAVNSRECWAIEKDAIIAAANKRRMFITAE